MPHVGFSLSFYPIPTEIISSFATQQHVPLGSPDFLQLSLFCICWLLGDEGSVNLCYIHFHLSESQPAQSPLAWKHLLYTACPSSSPAPCALGRVARMSKLLKIPTDAGGSEVSTPSPHPTPIPLPQTNPHLGTNDSLILLENSISDLCCSPSSICIHSNVIQDWPRFRIDKTVL